MSEINKKNPESGSFFTEEELTRVWANAHFGPDDDRKEEFIRNSMMKVAQGYSTGSTIRAIMIELGLIQVTLLGDKAWTTKGAKFMEHNPEIAQLKEEIQRLRSRQIIVSSPRRSGKTLLALHTENALLKDEISRLKESGTPIMGVDFGCGDTNPALIYGFIQDGTFHILGEHRVLAHPTCSECDHYFVDGDRCPLVNEWEVWCGDTLTYCSANTALKGVTDVPR